MPGDPSNNPELRQIYAYAQHRPRFEPWYLASIPGGLKIVQIVRGLLWPNAQNLLQIACAGTLVCIMLIHGLAIGTYFAAISALIGCCVSFILLIMYLYNLVHLCTLIDIVLWVRDCYDKASKIFRVKQRLFKLFV